MSVIGTSCEKMFHELIGLDTVALNLLPEGPLVNRFP